MSVDLLGRDEFSASKCPSAPDSGFQNRSPVGPCVVMCLSTYRIPQGNSNQGGNPNYLPPGFLTAGRKKQPLLKKISGLLMHPSIPSIIESL